MIHYNRVFWFAGNSVTNVVLIVPPIIGIFYYSKHGIEFRFIAMHLALAGGRMVIIFLHYVKDCISGITFAAVGIGSWLFHMTLKYEMQVCMLTTML